MANNFLGQDGFIWFVGVVEDRHDPKYAGRLRVRCLGYHTQNKTDLPTADFTLGATDTTYYFFWHIWHRPIAIRFS